MSVVVQTSVDKEMCLWVPHYEPSTEDQLAQFAATDAGAPLVEYWGKHAPSYLGLILARWNRINEVLPDAGVAELHDFVTNRLSVEERSFVWLALAG